jgi:hypothetical protein
MPTELDPYLGLTIDAVPDNLKGCLKGQPFIEISSGKPVVLLADICSSRQRYPMLDLQIDCIRYVNIADLALALDEELPTYLTCESLYLIQNPGEYIDIEDGKHHIMDTMGWRLHRIPQNVWGDMVGDFWFFDLDRQRKVLLMSYSGSGCLVEDPDAVAKWWVGACRLMLMVERTPGESMW